VFPEIIDGEVEQPSRKFDIDVTVQISGDDLIPLDLPVHAESFL